MEGLIRGSQTLVQRPYFPGKAPGIRCVKALLEATQRRDFLYALHLFRHGGAGGAGAAGGGGAFTRAEAARCLEAIFLRPYI